MKKASFALGAITLSMLLAMQTQIAIAAVATSDADSFSHVDEVTRKMLEREAAQRFGELGKSVKARVNKVAELGLPNLESPDQNLQAGIENLEAVIKESEEMHALIYYYATSMETKSRLILLLQLREQVTNAQELLDVYKTIFNKKVNSHTTKL